MDEVGNDVDKRSEEGEKNKKKVRRKPWSRKRRTAKKRRKEVLVVNRMENGPCIENLIGIKSMKKNMKNKRKKHKLKIKEILQTIKHKKE